jgi:hypothetical protein
VKVQPYGCGNVRACETYGPLTIAADRRCPPASLVLISFGGILRGTFVGRDYEPVKGQWYENVEEDETFRVLSVDEDSELVEIEYLDGDIEELDLDTWHEMDLERIEEPEGWASEDGDEEEDEDEDEDLDDEDDDWDDEDEDDDEDDDWDEDEEEEQY